MIDVNRFCLTYKVKKFIQGNGFLYSKHKYVFDKKSFYKNISKKSTDICVEAYPSSANTYLMYLIKNLNDDVEISHHTHTIANLKLAAQYNISCVVLIREPLDAISSYAYRFFNNTDKLLNRSISEYINFYEYVQNNKDFMKVVEFQELIDNPQTVLKNIQQYSGMDLKLDKVDWDQLIETSLNNIKDNAKKRGRLKRGSFPSESKEKGKSEIKNRIKNTKKYERAKEIYNKLTERV